MIKLCQSYNKSFIFFLWNNLGLIWNWEMFGELILNWKKKGKKNILTFFKFFSFWIKRITLSKILTYVLILLTITCKSWWLAYLKNFSFYVFQNQFQLLNFMWSNWDMVPPLLCAWQDDPYVTTTDNHAGKSNNVSIRFLWQTNKLIIPINWKLCLVCHQKHSSNKKSLSFSTHIIPYSRALTLPFFSVFFFFFESFCSIILWWNTLKTSLSCSLCKHLFVSSSSSSPYPSLFSLSFFFSWGRKFGAIVIFVVGTSHLAGWWSSAISVTGILIFSKSPQPTPFIYMFLATPSLQIRIMLSICSRPDSIIIQKENHSLPFLVISLVRVSSMWTEIHGCFRGKWLL